MANKNEMLPKIQHLKNLRHIFLCSVESVRPKNLLSASNNYNLEPILNSSNDTNSLKIQIQGKNVDISNKRLHVVGFGKAVLGMAVQLERSLGPHLTQGIISIPLGTQKQFIGVEEMQLSKGTKIIVFEGAPNNQPDEVALKAAKEIKNLAKSLNENDILFVLISGGGSALLPLPKPPLSLKEKMDLVRKLSNKGATIQEMNTVRIVLSDIKGGRLAAAASNASAVISFLISDIVGDPVDLIASGPTCGIANQKTSAREILQNYQLWEQLPDPLKTLIDAPADPNETKPGPNNTIYVVGDNRVATACAVQNALHCGYNPFIATTTLQGDVEDIVQMYKTFLHNIFDFRCQKLSEDELKSKFPFDPRTFQHFLKTLLMCQKTNKPLFLILAGEPTVKVKGSGLGGRNQELALKMSIELYNNPMFHEIVFLAAGTDGMDGPTMAAGAISCKDVIESFLKTSSFEEIDEFVQSNDSFSFYKDLECGMYHVMTGHTGTNVMDLHFMLIP